MQTLLTADPCLQPLAPHPSLSHPDKDQSQLSPVALSGEVKVSSDSELSQSEWRESGGDVTVCDHFTFLGEVSELGFRSLLEPKGEPHADQRSEGRGFYAGESRTLCSGSAMFSSDLCSTAVLSPLPPDQQCLFPAVSPPLAQPLPPKYIPSLVILVSSEQLLFLQILI